MVKCEICRSTKGKRKCKTLNNWICSKCCGKTRNWNFCNTTCYHFPSENVEKSLIPNGLELTEVVRGILQRFDEPLFLPNIYDSITCNVKNLNINLVEFNRVIIDIEFKLTANREVEKELYLKDSWKIHDKRVSNSQGDILAPLVIVYTNSTGTSKLSDNKYYYNDCSFDEVKTSYNYSIWFPYSYPQLENVTVKDMPEFAGAREISATCIYGRHVFKKNDILQYYLQVALKN